MWCLGKALEFKRRRARPAEAGSFAASVSINDLELLLTVLELAKEQTGDECDKEIDAPWTR